MIGVDYQALARASGGLVPKSADVAQRLKLRVAGHFLLKVQELLIRRIKTVFRKQQCAIIAGVPLSPYATSYYENLLTQTP